MSASPLRLVSFDVTNTLIRIKGSPGIQYSRVARKFGIDVDENVLTSVWLQKYKKFSSEYPNFGRAVNMPANTWWSRLVKECFLAVDSRLPEDLLDNMADSLFVHFGTEEAWELLPGAADAVRDLRAYNVKTAIISNWDDRLFQLLSSLRLRDCFDFILPSYVLGVEKPGPAIFLKALQDAQCQAEAAVHCGDNAEKDFMGARNVGMDAYLLRAEGQEVDFNLTAHRAFVVPDVQRFVDAIRPRLDPKPESKCSR